MPVYEYVGVDARGKATKGQFDADNPRSLRVQLQQKNIFLTEYYEGKQVAERRKRDVNLKLGDVSIMTRQLATLQRAGIPLVESLSALVEQTEHEELKRVISDIRQQVNEGITLNKAMNDHPKVFSPLYINMIRAGESSGTLDVVLERLADFLDDQQTLRSKVVGAMVYPIIMMILGFLIVAFLMAFVVPQLTAIYSDQDAALPLPTTLLIFASHVVTKFWWLLGIVAGGTIYAFRRWKATPEGRRKYDELTLKAPVVGDLQRLIAVTRFSKTLSTLLGSGVSLLGALDIVKNILGNTVLIEVIEQARLNIREGESIAAPLKRSGQFPPMVTHMIAVGEKTGALEQMLDNVATAYEQQINTRIAALTTLLEPLMIVLMGGTVGFIVFAILLPILQLNQTMTGG